MHIYMTAQSQYHSRQYTVNSSQERVYVIPTVSFYLLQEETSSDQKYGYGEEIICGRITLSILQKILSDLRDNIFILICGTRSFEKNMLSNMELMGIPPETYHKF